MPFLLDIRFSEKHIGKAGERTGQAIRNPRSTIIGTVHKAMVVGTVGLWGSLARKEK